MNHKLKLFVHNFSYALFSNMMSFLVNALIIICLPKVIGEAEYGYFQYYTMLATYVLILHCGWIDGIYLRYGGRQVDTLSRRTFASQFWGIVLFSILQMALFTFILQLFGKESDKHIVFIYLIVSIIIVQPKTYASVVLQATNQMKEYSIIILLEKVVYGVVLFFLLLRGERDYKILLLSDIIGKLCSMSYGIYKCRDLIFVRFQFIRDDFVEAVDNVRAGVFIVLSNLCNTMVTSITQMFIEYKWGIETFGKVSLTFNISRMLMVVINTVSVVLFPIIKNVEKDKLSTVYMTIRHFIMIALSGIFIFYYPLKAIMTMWLPQYEESFRFAILLLPMCIFESKSALLANTYLKALRKEKELFYVNVAVVAVDVILAGIMVFAVQNLEWAILSITLTLMIKSFLMEYFIGKSIKISVRIEILKEVLLIAAFIVISWSIESFVSMFLYAVAYVVYLISEKKAIMEIYRLIKPHKVLTSDKNVQL